MQERALLLPLRKKEINQLIILQLTNSFITTCYLLSTIYPLRLFYIFPHPYPYIYIIFFCSSSTHGFLDLLSYTYPIIFHLYKRLYLTPLFLLFMLSSQRHLPNCKFVHINLFPDIYQLCFSQIDLFILHSFPSFIFFIYTFLDRFVTPHLYVPILFFLQYYIDLFYPIFTFVMVFNVLYSTLICGYILESMFSYRFI